MTEPQLGADTSLPDKPNIFQVFLYTLLTMLALGGITYIFQPSAESLTTGAEGGYSVLGELINAWSVRISIIASAFITLIISAAGIMKRESETTKWYMFISIALVSLATTIALGGLTVYLNQQSYTKGPVHWHAGFEFIGCGERINLKDPKGLVNKIGATELHEHNDYWIHLEGVPITSRDASFGRFLEVTGIIVTDSYMRVPTNEGVAAYEEGKDKCGGEDGKVQAFLWTTDKEAKTFSQKKFANIHDLKEHVIRDEGAIPPGDCIVVEYDKPKEKTEQLCEQYFRAIERGDYKKAEAS